MLSIKTFFIFLLSLVSLTGQSQQTYTLPNNANVQLKDYAVLHDRSYSFKQILADTSLHFTEKDDLRPKQAAAYWLKIKLVSLSHYPEKYNLRIRPVINNTLYVYNADTKTWDSAKAGIMVATDKNLQQGNLPFVLLGNGFINILYIKIDFGTLQPFGYTLHPEITIKTQSMADSRDRLLWLSWVVSITVLLLFFLHNLHIYYSFRDKTIVYYLAVQLGAMVYITAYKNFFDLIFETKAFTFKLLPDRALYSYGCNSILMHVSVVIIMCGFVQLTRSYLNTKKALPRIDKTLRFGLYGYMAVSVLLILINVFVFFVDAAALPYENVFVFALVAAMFYTGVVAYRRKFPAAGPFLLANVLPFACILLVSLYHVLVKVYYAETSLLPDLAVISQAFIFSAALVARIKLIQKELKAKEVEAQQLIFNIRELELEQQLMELENEQITANMLHEKKQNVLLQQKLETNQRELASTSLFLLQKNEMLANLKTQIKELRKEYPANNIDTVEQIESFLRHNQYMDDDWGKFKLHFEQVHPDFFSNLYSEHPTLTKNELRLHAYFHMNLGTKEIAALLNIDPASVRRAKSRLNKKMNGE